MLSITDGSRYNALNLSKELNIKSKNFYLTVKYAFFAVIATTVNLGLQYLSLLVYSGIFDLYIAMIAGTGAGLIVKYILDKKFIFYYTVKNKKEDVGKFLVYTLMGVITTLIFWGTELCFNALFHFDSAKYIGGAIGLTAGYIIKYLLDRKYVFIN